MLDSFLLTQSARRALDRLAAIMDTGEPRDQIRAAALTIDAVLRLYRVADRQSRRAGQVARNEVRCILLLDCSEQAPESTRKAA